MRGNIWMGRDQSIRAWDAMGKKGKSGHVFSSLFSCMRSSGRYSSTIVSYQHYWGRYKQEWRFSFPEEKKSSHNTDAQSIESTMFYMKPSIQSTNTSSHESRFHGMSADITQTACLQTTTRNSPPRVSTPYPEEKDSVLPLARKRARTNQQPKHLNFALKKKKATTQKKRNRWMNASTENRTQISG